VELGRSLLTRDITGAWVSIRRVRPRDSAEAK